MLRITVNWPASFRKLRSLLVEAQGELLRRLDWRVRINFEREAAPCGRWLFGGGGGLPGGSSGIGAGVAAEQWAACIRGACAAVRKQVRVDISAAGHLPAVGMPCSIHPLCSIGILILPGLAASSLGAEAHCCL